MMKPLLLLVALLHCSCALPVPQESYSLPVVKYADLVTLDTATAHELAKILTTTGALQIEGIPRYGMIRKRALEDLAECFESEGASPMLTLPDGSRRTSAAAVTHKGVAGEMSHICGQAADRLRAAVDATTRQLFLALDKVKQGTLMAPFESFSELMGEGEHLEHLHAYTSPAAPTTPSAVPALNYHTDAGLLIAMTTGLYSSPSAGGGLYMRLDGGEGRYVQVTAEDDNLIILIGDGAARWLSPVLGKPLHAVTHALYPFPLAATGPLTRAWYGKMYLPPANAMVQGMRYEEYHQKEGSSAALSTASRDTEDPLLALLPSACGGNLPASGSPRRYLAAVADNCPADQMWCWAQCMDISTLSCASPVCTDMHTGLPTDPNGMCMEMGTGKSYCEPQCDTPTNATFDGYCYGNGVSMFMQGFVSIIDKGESNTECVNLLFPQWTLDSSTKYAFACIGVFLMCICIQAVASFRTKLPKLVKDPSHRTVANVLCYGVHVTLGYFAMLTAMTYSVELFCMIVFGLTAGFALFQHSSPLSSTDPCCGELDAFSYNKLDEDKAEKQKLTTNMVQEEEYNCCAHDA